MKLYLSALLFAIALASALAIVVHVYSPHSTPGIWMMLAGIPGTVVGVWIGLLTRENEFVFYFVAVLVNWAFYVYLAKGLLWLKLKLSHSTAAGRSN